MSLRVNSWSAERLARPILGSKKKTSAFVIAALILALFLFRPGIYRLRNRIAISIGSALGRRVALDNVRLRLLPRPGFDLEGLVIYDDPAFSAEPMIRAQEVSAVIRLRSVFRGHLEIANLSATDPSINLVRNDQGRWNLATLIEHNSQIPAAPTAKAASEHRPAFPYLEATSARINFKLGQTKKSYALVNADVALWQESENSWGARMRAEPVRTDFNLTDTGSVQLNATWQRAPNLRLTPVQMTLQWRNGQLGQITKMFTGKDRGWRGGIDLVATLTGTAEDLKIDSQTTLDDFHRYDISPTENVRLATICSARYDAIARSFTRVLCESPTGEGTLRLRGNAAFASAQPTYDLTLQIDKMPLSSAVRLLQQAKLQVPGDLTATGLLNAEFHATSSAAQAARPGVAHYGWREWSGTGIATNVRLSSGAGAGSSKNEVDFGTIPLTLAGPTSPFRRPVSLHGTDKDQEPNEVHLVVGPLALSINDSAPLDANGWMSPTGYRFTLRGDTTLQSLFRLENMVGLPGARPPAEGSATLNVSAYGPWLGFAAATTAGTAQIRNLHAVMRGLNTPIEITSASVTLLPDMALLQKLLARTGATHWSGNIGATRHCAILSAAQMNAPSGVPNCTFQFDLSADQFSIADLTTWFSRPSEKRPWYRFLGSNFNDPEGPSPLLAIQAHGSLRVARLGLKKTSATQIDTQVEIDRGKIKLSNLRAQLFQGTHQGDWTIDFSRADPASAPLRYQATGILQDISLAQVSTLMNDSWITGLADAKFELQGAGGNFREALAASDARLQYVMRDGSLPHIVFPGSRTPFSVHRFFGNLRLKNAAWELAGGRLESHDGIYQVSGTISPVHDCDFVLTRGDAQSWNLTGTLAEPHLAARPDITISNSEPFR